MSPEHSPVETREQQRDSRDEDLWKRLLPLIEERQVVPVIGRDLLTIERDGGQILLHHWLARELAVALGVELGSGVNPTSLNAVACEYLAHTRDPEPERIYETLHDLLRRQSGVPISEPLKQLAKIEPFRLFVSTTFDSLLTQAINAVRFNGREDTEVVAYTPKRRRDLGSDVAELDTPVVYHLLGRVSPLEHYVVTEEDALEFIHSLRGSGLPANLLNALHDRPLLIIGCSFPGWLVRFFIRAARRKRLLLARGKTDFVVDATGRDEPALLAFLRNFRTRTEFFHHSDPVTFVDELYGRWRKRLADQAPDEGPQPVTPAPTLPVVNPATVFLSYASDDVAAAEAIRDALDAAGIDVWFDRERLSTGEQFENRIRRLIEQASVFIPVLSRSCVTPERRFFRREWKHAERTAETVPELGKFILPVVIDDLPTDHEYVPSSFARLHWHRAPDGRVTPAFVLLVRDLYRDYQDRTTIRA